MLTRSKAVRFLQQATFGGSPVDVENLQTIGIDAWLDDQFDLPQTESILDRLVDADIDAPLRFIWSGYLADPDQLRKRWSYALSQVFVTSVYGVGVHVAAYADILEQHCFGTYRDLIEKITYSSAMGLWLTYHGNRRAGSYRSNEPDENYAREIMQLFSIGLWQLHPDGTRRLDGSGRPIPTYTQDDVKGLARVFTGMTSPPLENDFSRARLPMDADGPFASYFHERGEKRFLGTVIPAKTDRSIEESVGMALDALAAHSNVGPFLSRQFIQRLVTSNPTPAYVARVSGVFDDDGAGVRGNLGAVVRAILTDAEARTPEVGPTDGKLREPVLRFTTIMRALNMGADGRPWPIMDTSNSSTELGQTPYSSRSVFNFYRPGYVPPQTRLADAGVTAPEFQIHDETSSIGWVNYTLRAISHSLVHYFAYAQPDQYRVDSTIDISDLVTHVSGARVDAVRAARLVDEMAGRLCPHGISPAIRSLAIDAVVGIEELHYDRDDIYTTIRHDRVHRERVAAATMIVAVSPDFLHER